MMIRMKQRLLGFWCVILGLLWTPAMLLASRPQQDDREVIDGRLEGYGRNVTLEGSSTALTWILLIFLTVVCVAALFKNAKRTHLD
jgi:hypothetical protein